mmetsp:Transcript_21415/g.20586  ORF Transcript_21415/g.20586 Transcript_21415/m.20586 type:complete len:130 (-) Transcript_21415:39-428(-)|eukprot:CAMPEP_0170544924 /NCGR_PEP_ID=MMETSP0211-20121228/3500_1 /TAXON_ID=311385 /ORGANISM="Pseudokeronopsis sp., Strain OXSARD2" /LENGTH=129 /DNA_ID=CAMNT_0010848691 /DNA_START=535 /DNA_END=924 /DNA_ORIENTATION=-
MAVVCRVDKQPLRYELDLELFSNVDIEESYHEFASVGRIYMKLVKAKKPERWRRLLQQTEKIPNMSLWWELHEKYEEELLDHTTFETDDKLEQFVHIANDRPPKKKKKKSKKSKKTKDEDEDLFKHEDL